MLVVVNFSKEDKMVDVIIPENAFSVLGFRDNQAAYLKDLLSGEEFIGTLTEACPYRLFGALNKTDASYNSIWSNNI